VIASRRKEQQRFSDRIPALGIALQQQSTNCLGAPGAAGFTRSLSADPGPRQRLDEKRDLGRFTSALPAFDGDEFAALTQCRLPQIR
jgi:hypothetical protein